MKTIFYVISIVVIAAAAFFTYTTSNKIQEEIDLYAEKRGLKQNVERTIDEKQEDLDNTSAALAESNKKNAFLDNKLDNERAKQQASQKALEGYQTEIAEYDAELESLAKVEAEAKAKLEGIGGEEITWDNIGSRIRELQEERKDKGNRMTELNVLVENLTKEVADKREEHSRQTSNLAEVRRKIALNSKVGAITVVDSTWGFVVVNLGSNNSNITSQSKLLVTRNGRLLGTLTPNSVEPTQTICDLNARDLAPGVRIQPGDKVTLAETVGGR